MTQDALSYECVRSCPPGHSHSDHKDDIYEFFCLETPISMWMHTRRHFKIEKIIEKVSRFNETIERQLGYDPYRPGYGHPRNIQTT